MSKLSIGAMLAWQVAAGEAAAAGHEFIVPEHLLIGICSLDKWLKSGVAAEPQAREAALVERDAVAEALRGCGLDCGTAAPATCERNSGGETTSWPAGSCTAARSAKPPSGGRRRWSGRAAPYLSASAGCPHGGSGSHRRSGAGRRSRAA